MIFFTSILMVVFGSFIFFAEEGHFEVTPEFPQGAYYRKSIDGK